MFLSTFHHSTVLWTVDAEVILIVLLIFFSFLSFWLDATYLLESVSVTPWLPLAAGVY